MTLRVYTVNDIVVTTRNFHLTLASILRKRAQHIRFQSEKLLMEYLADREQGIADLLYVVEDDEDALKLGNWVEDYFQEKSVLSKDINRVLENCENSVQVREVVSNIYNDLQDMYEFVLYKSDTEPAHETVESILALYKFVGKRPSFVSQVAVNG